MHARGGGCGARRLSLTLFTDPIQFNLQRLAAVDKNEGGIYTSADSGANWTEIFIAVDPDWVGIASSSDGTVRQV